jgi:hypothetical protein
MDLDLKGKMIIVNVVLEEPVADKSSIFQKIIK